MVIDLNKKNFRDQNRKILGYRDMVKLVKHISKVDIWEEPHGISSFTIGLVVAKALIEKNTRYNHKQLDIVLQVLNE